MLDSTLTWMGVTGPVPQAELRAFASVVRAASRSEGFLSCQTFRGLDDTGTVLVFTRWESEAAARAGMDAARRHSRALGGPLGRRGAELLNSSSGNSRAVGTVFDLRLLRQVPAASLLRVANSARAPGITAEGRDKELALRSMAAPGSIRATGAFSARRDLWLCRIDFDLEDALWHFLDSSLRREWSALARALDQAEVWALNLPRLSREAEALAAAPPSRSATQQAGPLSLRLTVLPGRGTAVELRGRLDPRGSARLESVVDALVREGCRSLALDLCGLEDLSGRAALYLLAVVRRAKDGGVAVRLVERRDRFDRATRAIFLERSAASTE